jgi:alanyl-tRNA synthetase
MGIERVAALLQGTNDNYATDLVRNLIEGLSAGHLFGSRRSA